MNIHGTYLGAIVLTNQEIFLDYVNKFDCKEKEIKRKVDHSIRVSKLCRSIAEDLSLPKDVIEVVEFIGLVHDIGRFTQWQEYKTFDDLKSEDHALIGLRVLFDNNLIDLFNIDRFWFKTIFLAIKNHNQYEISSDTKDLDLVISKILRDADKADILYLIKNKELILEEDNSGISRNVSEAFLSNEEIRHTIKMTISEKILLKFGFIYDINYKWTLNYIRNECILESIYNGLKYKDKIKKYYIHVNKYLMEACNGKI